MAVLRELLARFNIRVDDDQLQKGDRKLEGFKRGLQKVGALIGGGLLVRQVSRFAQGQVELLDEIDKTSKQLGIGAEALQEYRFAAERSGVQMRTLDMGLQRFTRRLSEADKGTGEAKDALRELGVDTSADAEVALMQAADALSQVENGADKTRLAFKLFDSEGVRMLNMLDGGSEGLQKLREEARKMGGVFDKDAVGQGAEASDAMTNFKFAIRGLSGSMAIELLPQLTKGIGVLTRWLQQLKQTPGALDAIRTAVISLGIAIGVVLVVTFFKAILATALFAAIVGVAILVIDDLITFIDGGDSAIGRLIASIFGLEDSTQAFELLKFAMMELIRAWDLGVSTVKSLGMAAIDVVTAMQQAFFGLFRGVGAGFAKLMTGDFQGAADAVKKSFTPALEEAHSAMSNLRSAGRTAGKGFDMLRGIGEGEGGVFGTEGMRAFMEESNRRHAQREKLRRQEQFAVKQGLLSPEEARAAREAAVRRGGVGRLSADQHMARNPNLGPGEQFAAQLAAGNINIDVQDRRASNAQVGDEVGRRVAEELDRRDRDVAEAVSDDQ